MAKKQQDEAKVLSAFVDRIEDSLAVITSAEDDALHFDLPLALLPTGTKAGDWLKLTFEIDDERAVAARDRVAALQAELTSETESETYIKL